MIAGVSNSEALSFKLIPQRRKFFLTGSDSIFNSSIIFEKKKKDQRQNQM